MSNKLSHIILSAILTTQLILISSVHNFKVSEDNKPVPYYGSVVYKISGSTKGFFVSNVSIVFRNEDIGIPLASFDQNGKKFYNGNYWNHYISKIKQDIIYLSHLDHYFDGAKIRVSLIDSNQHQRYNIDTKPINLKYVLGEKRKMHGRPGFYIKGEPAEIKDDRIVIPVDSRECFEKASCAVGFCEEYEENCKTIPFGTAVSDVVISKTIVRISLNNITISGNLLKKLGSTVVLSCNGRISSSQPISYGDRFVQKSKSGKTIKYYLKTPGDITNYTLSFIYKGMAVPTKLCSCNVESEEDCTNLDTRNIKRCSKEIIEFKENVSGIVMVSIIHSYTIRDEEGLFYKETNGIAGMLQK